MRLLRWFIAVLNGSAGLLLKALGISYADGHRHIHSPEEIELLLAESRDGGLLEPDEHNRLHRALQLGMRTARQLMVPRGSVFTLDARATGEEMLRSLLQTPFSRVPVTDGSIDRVIGVLHTREAVRSYVEHRDPERIRAAVRTVSAVPDSMPADALLRLLRDEKGELALVVDEYGGFAGIVTVSDVLAELLGPVDAPSASRARVAETLADGRVRLSGQLRLRDLPPPLAALWQHDADTVSGLVLRATGRLPNAGERLVIDKIQVEVEQLAGRVPASVIVTLPPPVKGEHG